MKISLISTGFILATASVLYGARIQFTETKYRVVEGSEQAMALVELTDCPTRAPLGSVGVQVVAVDATAHESEDYFAFSEFEIGSTPPPPGSRLGRVFKTQEVPIHVVDDDEKESEESFHLTLLLHPDATLDCGSGPEQPELGERATVTIVSNDERTTRLEFEAVDHLVREGDGATRVVARLAVRRIGGAGTAEVTCTTGEDGSATADEDFLPTRQTLRWKSDEMDQKSCEVEILADDLVEGEETVRLSLIAPSRGTTLGAQSSAMLQIEDDDDAGQISFTAVEYVAAEGEGEAEVTVARLGGSDGAISVDYLARGGSAREVEDFAPASGRLLWPAGDSAPKRLRLQIFDDRTEEETETFTLLLSTPSGGATLGDFANAVVLIGDNDGDARETWTATKTTPRRSSERDRLPAPAKRQNNAPAIVPATATRNTAVAMPAVPTLEINDVVVIEGDHGVVHAVFEVALSAASDDVVTVEYKTVDESAKIADNDYLPRAGRFRFRPGQTSLRFNVQVLGDGFVEGDQVFHVQLSHPTGAELLDSRGSATIRNDDGRRLNSD